MNIIGDYKERALGDSVSTYAWIGGGTVMVNGLTYYMFTDDQCSILKIVSYNGTKVFDVSYDPWGVGGIGHEQLRAGAHGLAGGVTGAISGSGFGSGFASGLGSSLMGSFAMSSRLSPAALIAATSSMGGILSVVTGGDFYSGAMNGLKIGALNFADGEIIYTHDAEGNITGRIKEIKISANEKAQKYLEITETFKPIGYGLTFVKGVNDYAERCRIGTNGKLYLPKNKHVFYGNQRVKTSPITTMKYLKAMNRAYDFGEDAATFKALYEADGQRLGYNSRKYLAHVAGREIGSNIGSKIGAGIGEGAGVGVLSVPLGIVLGIAGDYIGGELGGSISDFFFDLTY